MSGKGHSNHYTKGNGVSSRQDLWDPRVVQTAVHCLHLSFVLYHGLGNGLLILSHHQVQQDLEYHRTKEKAIGHKVYVYKSQLSCSNRRPGRREGGNRHADSDL